MILVTNFIKIYFKLKIKNLILNLFQLDAKATIQIFI